MPVPPQALKKGNVRVENNRKLVFTKPDYRKNWQELSSASYVQVRFLP